MPARKVSKKKKASDKKGKLKDPKATRPHMPGYGIFRGKAGMLPWKWATDRLSKSRQYWVATVRPEGAPHVMLVWGLWVENEFWFSTGDNTRKARNLAANPNCVVCSDDSAQAAIVEGTADVVADAELLEKLADVYEKKYKVDIRGMNAPMYRVRPRVVFGLFEKKFPKTATRWKFDGNR